MKPLSAGLVALAIIVGPAFAQAIHDHSHGAMIQASQVNPMVNGEVRKVDKEQGKLTLAHEPIPNLGMPQMTMVFRVKDKAFLDQVSTGEKVKFAADRIDGQLTVVAVQRVQ